MSCQYLLDANVFIHAHRFTYPMDVFPIFWEWLNSQFNGGSIASISFIYDEIKNGEDELTDWVKLIDTERCFLPIEDNATQSNFALIANWVMTQNFKQTAVGEFLSVADPWLIAKAKTLGATVVTQEKSAPNSQRKIYIPDICNAFGVKYLNTIELLRARNGKF